MYPTQRLSLCPLAGNGVSCVSSLCVSLSVCVFVCVSMSMSLCGYMCKHVCLPLYGHGMPICLDTAHHIGLFAPSTLSILHEILPQFPRFPCTHIHSFSSNVDLTFVYRPYHQNYRTYRAFRFEILRNRVEKWLMFRGRRGWGEVSLISKHEISELLDRPLVR